MLEAVKPLVSSEHMAKAHAPNTRGINILTAMTGKLAGLAGRNNLTDPRKGLLWRQLWNMGCNKEPQHQSREDNSR